MPSALQTSWSLLCSNGVGDRATRALGGSRAHIRIQFLADAIVLSPLGGVAGITTGAAATAVYAAGKGWTTVIPANAWVGGLARRHPHRRSRPAALY
jgi:hypothetical protein